MVPPKFFGLAAVVNRASAESRNPRGFTSKRDSDTRSMKSEAMTHDSKHPQFGMNLEKRRYQEVKTEK